MKMKEYQERAMSTRTESSDNFTYMFAGLVAEVGEIADKVAKAKRKDILTIRNDELSGYSADEDKKVKAIGAGYDIAYELGDVLWFVAGLADNLGYSLEEIAQMNLDKLADRKKRGVIVGDDDNR